MELPSNTKIEDRAIGALKNIIDDDLTMISQFNSMDKEMAWDGYIWIFKENNGDQSKKNLDDKVPVQIKGHIDEKEKYINKEIISFPVDLIDLDIYFNDRGVVYFSIFMSNDGKKREIFYSSLYPSKIKAYLERADKKGNKNSINISFRKLKKNPQELYIILKQFSRESRIQGFGTGEIVQNTISLSGEEKITSITATVIGVNNELDFLQKLATGDVCFYGTTEKNRIKVPIKWSDKNKYFIRKEVKQKVIVDGIVYYEKYQISMSSDKEIFFYFSDNFKIDILNGKFDFSPRTKMEQIRKDAEFLLTFFKSEKLYIGENEIKYGKVNISNDFIQSLNFFIDLDNILKELHFYYEVPHKLWTDEVKYQMINLVKMKKGMYNHNFSEKVHIYNWKIEDKYLPIAVIRHDEDECNNMVNAITTQSLRAAVSDIQGNFYTVPVFSFIDWHVIIKMYKYDYEYLYEQIDAAEINETTMNEMNNAALKLVAVYDSNGDKKLLEIALYCLNKMYELEVEREYVLINIFQIKKRLGILDEKDIKILNSWNNQNLDVMFAQSVLLDDKDSAKKYWDKMGKELKKYLKKYPIFNLYNKLSTQ